MRNHAHGNARLWVSVMLGLACLVASVAGPARLMAQATTDAQADSLQRVENKKNFLLAATEVFGVNLFVWSYNRFLREGGTNPGFRISLESWGENLQNGWEWDDNNFNTNQFAHPYHGSLYYNGARSNGYGYWESIPFAFAGSFMWEYFGETHHPSINDWFSTAIGGIAMGESLHRLATLVRDNEATGSSRTWGELGALPLDPVGTFTRLVTGDAFRVHPNPVDRVPSRFRTVFDIGLRTVGEDRLWDADTTRGYMSFQFEYGDPYETPIKKPFDFFDFDLQLNFSDITTLGVVGTRGALFGTNLSESENSRHLITVFHHFDYMNNSVFEFGGQELGVAFLSQFEAPASRLRTELHLNTILMAGTKSDYESISGRSYDYGPGVSFKFKAAVERKGRDLFTIAHDNFWIHAMNGNVADHFVSMTRVRGDIPLTGNLAVGAEYVLYLAERTYRDYPDVSQRSPQLRLLFSFLMN